jgi:hypothetical protein
MQSVPSVPFGTSLLPDILDGRA